LKKQCAGFFFFCVAAECVKYSNGNTNKLNALSPWKFPASSGFSFSAQRIPIRIDLIQSPHSNWIKSSRAKECYSQPKSNYVCAEEAIKFD